LVVGHNEESQDGLVAEIQCRAEQSLRLCKVQATDGGGTLPSSRSLIGKVMQTAKQGAEESDGFDFVKPFRRKFQQPQHNKPQEDKRTLGEFATCDLAAAVDSKREV